MEDDISQPRGGIAAFDALSESEWRSVQVKLWQLLARTSQLYTMDDSSSVRVETAQDLLTSICFTLGAYLKKTGESQKLLVTAELDGLLEAGRVILEAEIEEGKRLWQAACVGTPQIDNLSYRDTLQGIGGFFERYDFRFFAHQIPCDIDYQLGRPIPETVQGIAYINEYLRRILAENSILQQFDTGLVIRLLKSYCQDYRGLLINLCEPVLTNAVGLTLIGGDPFSLQLTDSHRSQLTELFALLPESKALPRLADASGCFCCAAGISDRFTQEYAADMAKELSPRIAAALSAGDLAGIFLSFT